MDILDGPLFLTDSDSDGFTLYRPNKGYDLLDIEHHNGSVVSLLVLKRPYGRFRRP